MMAFWERPLFLTYTLIEKIGHHEMHLRYIGSIVTTNISTPMHFAAENGHLEGDAIKKK